MYFSRINQIRMWFISWHNLIIICSICAHYHIENISKFKKHLILITLNIERVVMRLNDFFILHVSKRWLHSFYSPFYKCWVRQSYKSINILFYYYRWLVCDSYMEYRYVLHYVIGLCWSKSIFVNERLNESKYISAILLLLNFFICYRNIRQTMKYIDTTY